jgi:ribonucleoside-triphosphate reductase
VTIFEKANLAVIAQRYWSDNAVSVTLSFDPETEAKHIGTILYMHEGQLKTVSFLPKGNNVYPQQPYTCITQEDWDVASTRLAHIDFESIYMGLSASDAVGEAYCTNDVCEIQGKDSRQVSIK